MAQLEEIVGRLGRGAEAGHVIVMGRIQIGFLAAGQHLMRIGLVADVEDQLICRRIEDVMQGDGGFHDAEIRTEMSAMDRGPGQHGLSHLLGQSFELGRVQLLHIRGTIDLFQIHVR